MRGTRWLIVVFTISLALLAGGIGEAAGSFTDSEASIASGFQAWTSALWRQTTLADFEGGVVPIRADTRSSPGDVKLARTSGIFAFQGGTASFWRYGVTDNTWATMASPLAPNTVGAGGALAYDGTRYIYAFRGGGSTTFWRYDTTSNTWTTLTGSAAANNGGGLACVGTTYVYALFGNGTTFRRYRIALGNWQNRAGALLPVGAGGALAYDNTQYIYALRGGGNTTFWRYDTVGNTWTSMRVTPAAVNAGGALAYVGGYVYAFQGGGSNTFWRYSIAGDNWTAMTSAPAAVNAGGALAYDGSGYIYAFQGGSNTFWRYDVLNNRWAAMATPTGAVAAGGALAFVPGSTYVDSATVASQVLNTNTPGDRWNALFWDRTLPANTNITFEVRASDNSFAADNATLPWISVGGTSPVTSGLPSGQYMQWRATLTTTNTAVTPLLAEVRLYHY